MGSSGISGRAALLTCAAALVLAGCGADDGADPAGGGPTSTRATVASTGPTVNPIGATTGATAPTTDATAPPATGPRVAVVGVVEADDGGHEVCLRAGQCSGIHLAGEPFADWVAGADLAERVRLVGTFDGATLTVTEPIEAAGPDPWSRFDRGFPVPCPTPEGGWPVGGFPAAGFEDHLSAHGDQLAARWAGDGGVSVLAFTGEIDAHRAALTELWPDGRLCVVQMAHARRDLEAAVQGAFDLVRASGSVPMDGLLDELDNVVRVDVWRTDQATLDELAARYGDAVVVEAFLVALEGPVGSLPAPPAPGPDEIPLVTAPFPTGGGLDALGRFTLGYDAELDCLFLAQGDGTRVLPVWPYGTTARRGTLEVLDDHDRAVATVADQISGGGGFGAPATHFTDQTCGATDSWSFNGSPTVV